MSEEGAEVVVVGVAVVVVVCCGASVVDDCFSDSPFSVVVKSAGAGVVEMSDSIDSVVVSVASPPLG